MKPPRLPDLPRPLVWFFTFAIIVFLGFLDYATGRELTISALYLAPICWGTWRLGRIAGWTFSAISVLTWLAADLASGCAYTSPAIAVWNITMLLAFFGLVVFLLAKFQSTHRNLEKTVEHRTVALRMEMAERKRMENAKLQAERLAMVGTMAAQVAHEVRNPLGAISLNLDLVQHEIDAIRCNPSDCAAEAKTLVTEMREEVQRIEKVITDYLVLARPQAIRRSRVDLADFIDRKLGIIKGTLDQASIKVRKSYTPDPVLIDADEEQLWQAILNLIRNSLDAMPDGGRLTIKTDRQHDMALLVLADTGSGMTRAQQDRLFVPFATTKSRGTGLGLPLVQRIVAEHQGKIVCTSQQGEGTTFILFLPIHKEIPLDKAVGNISAHQRTSIHG